ncbi:MAG TPA: hypothetical protein VM598_09680, partial [Bdellovibrionota bacterium]|nr:hypothetical protein [Bdellovibrionota bacterium]
MRQGWMVRAILVSVLCAGVLPAGVRADGYELPSAEIVEAVRSTVPPVLVQSPDQERVLILQYRRFLKLADLATPMLRLGGLRVDPSSHNQHLGTFSIGTDWTSLRIRNLLT